MKDIIFGDHPNSRHNNSSIKMFNVFTDNGTDDHNISVNSMSYWVYGLVFSRRAIIYKDSEQGKYITDLINCKGTAEEIMMYINLEVIKSLSPEYILDAYINQIEKEKEDSFRAGERYKAKAIKALLEI